MAIGERSDGEHSFHKPVELITSNWIEPVECFVPEPCFTQPLEYCRLDNAVTNLNKQNLQVGPDEVLMAHETTKKNAQKIVANGFESEPKGFTPLRDRAVFGWIHKQDIGTFDEESDAGYVVFYKSDKRHCYVSSYNSSATKIITGEINAAEYEQNHVMKYGQYEKILWNHRELVEHLPYSHIGLIGF